MPDPTTTRPPAPDQGARDAISARTDATLFVDAGAGSGKTTKLVDRLLAVVDGTPGVAPVPLATVAAITFTEKAGAELRERLRRELERRLAAEPEAPTAAARRAALDDLDGAAIGTLHSFAQRILGEHPVEAGLPPRVEITDEIGSGVAFERRWRRWSDELFENPRYARTLLLLSAAGVADSTPAALARTFNANWDLVERHVDPDAPEPPRLEHRVDDLLARIEAACDMAGGCIDPSDKMVAHLAGLREWLEATRQADDEPATLEALMAVKVRAKLGRKTSWRHVDIDAVRDELARIDEAVADLRADVIDACAHHLGAAIRGFTLASAQARRASGALEFHDLLVLARLLLTDPTHGATVRTTLAQRYQRLLLDEFQDTDPIQVELAVRIAAADPGRDDGDGGGAPDWTDVAVAPGRLFVVGDPKQSIYRFRRADIAVYLRAKATLAGAGDRAVGLHANFRTVPGVVDVVNHVFARLMEEPPDDELFDPDTETTRPPYAPLTAVRPPGPSDGGPPVAVLGRTEHPYKTSAADVREAEAADVAATVARAVAEGWSVHDDDGWRPTRLGDVTILVPARTSLPYLEAALAAAGIPYRAEASSLVYATRAVRDLVLVARAVADPTDELRVVSALRTPLFGCGDDDLFRYRVERGGSWNYLAPRRATVPDDDPVALGLAALAGWHRDRPWRTPAALLDAIAHDRRALELAFTDGRPRDTWRRLRFVIDQARAWAEATSGDLRGYLEWVDQQTAEGARVAESVLPETDDDAVRIMTIHAAKGLEFPITIVSGLSSAPQTGHRPGDARFTGDGVAYNLGRRATTTAYEAWKPLDEQMDLDERIRLLYVATTRARDHLVVSLHRVARKSAPAPGRRTNAELLVEGLGASLDDLPDIGPAPDAGPTVVARPAPPAPLEPFAEWEAAHRAALAAASRATTVSATALTAEAQHDPVLPTDPEGPVSDATPDPAAPDAAAAAPDPAAPDAAAAGPGETGSGQLALDFGAPADPDLDRAADGTDGGLRKRPGDLDRPPWLKGRYGTAVGRAVHGVLQTVPLHADPTGPEVAAAVAAQAQAEAVPDRADLVAALVADALRSPVVQAAAIAPHWREIFVGVPVGERLLEGYVDLLYRGPDGLVVVDYKTAGTTDPAELDRRVEGYRLQGGAYALAVARATGEPVTEVVFCFLTPIGAVERSLLDLPAAVAEVEAQVSAGAELEVG